MAAESLKNVLKVAFGTLNSRILGLVRDMLTLAYLGMNAVSSGFVWGFNLPNLFRRLMGEGALASAFIPVFTSTLHDDGKDKAFSFLNRVITRISLVLIGMVLLGIAVLLFYHFLFAREDRVIMGSNFAAIMMPYMFFICLAAILCGALNVMGSFTIPALNAVWLNIAMIISIIAAGFFYGSDVVSIARFMCYGVLVGGFAQFLIPAYELRRKGWRFKPDFGKCDALGELFKIFFPALLGAGIIQLNMFVIGTLALVIDDTASSAIYATSRLVELPLGMFTISIVTVYFPKLSMLANTSKTEEYSREYSNGLVSIMFITLPAACGLFVLREDILSLIFEWGKFGSADVATCAPLLAISAIGIPLYSLATFSTRGFHSFKNTKTPVKISAVAFFINIAAALSLMGTYGAKGLVAANVISALFQAIALNACFRKQKKSTGAFLEISKTIFASMFMVAALYALHPLALALGDGKISALISCAALIPAGVAVYMISLALLRFKGFKEIKHILRKEK